MTAFGSGEFGEEWCEEEEEEGEEVNEEFFGVKFFHDDVLFYQNWIPF